MQEIRNHENGNKNGNLLHVVASVKNPNKNHLDIANFLVKNNVDKFHTNDCGETPCMVVARCKKKSLFDFLGCKEKTLFDILKLDKNMPFVAGQNFSNLCYALSV